MCDVNTANVKVDKRVAKKEWKKALKCDVMCRERGTLRLSFWWRAEQGNNALEEGASRTDTNPRPDAKHFLFEIFATSRIPSSADSASVDPGLRFVFL